MLYLFGIGLGFCGGDFLDFGVMIKDINEGVVKDDGG